jgi:hypothetical protein
LSGAGNATEDGAVSGAGTGHEERHLILLRGHAKRATAVSVITTSAKATT